MLAIFSALLFSSGCSNSPEMTVLGQPWKCSYTLKSEHCPCGFPSLFLFKRPKSDLLCLQSWTLLRLWAMLVLKSSEVTSILPQELPRQPGLMNKTGYKLDALKQFKNCCRPICFFFTAEPICCCCWILTSPQYIIFLWIIYQTCSIGPDIFSSS